MANVPKREDRPINLEDQNKAFQIQTALQEKVKEFSREVANTFSNPANNNDHSLKDYNIYKNTYFHYISGAISNAVGTKIDGTPGKNSKGKKRMYYADSGIEEGKKLLNAIDQVIKEIKESPDRLSKTKEYLEKMFLGSIKYSRKSSKEFHDGKYADLQKKHSEFVVGDEKNKNSHDVFSFLLTFVHGLTDYEKEFVRKRFANYVNYSTYDFENE